MIATALSRANLTPYSVTAAAGGATRSLQAGAAPTTALGWYVDLPAGERFVGYPELVSGILFMPTYAPLAASSGCSTDGVNWLFGLNPRTGVGALSGVRMGSKWVYACHRFCRYFSQHGRKRSGQGCGRIGRAAA